MDKRSPKSHYKMPAAVYVILLQNNHILLLRRQNTGYEDGSYSLIAGHLDGDEEVLDAAIREAQEEANISLDRDSIQVVGVMHRRSDDERIDFFVTANRWAGTITNMEPEKCDDLSWFPLDNLPDNVIPHVRSAIQTEPADIWFQSFGWND